MSVYFYGCVTMDGYLADKEHNLDWLYQSGSVEETDYESFYKNMDITIMGKRTFAEIEKSEGAESFYPTTQNYVFTHSEQLSRKGFIPIKGDVAEFVKQIDWITIWLTRSSCRLHLYYWEKEFLCFPKKKQGNVLG